MKKIIIVVLALLITNAAFALDTDLGKVSLTKNQVARLPELRGNLDGAVKGFGYHFAEEKLVVVTDRELTDLEKISLVDSAKSLSGSAIPIPKTEEELLKERVTALESKMSKAETDIGALKPK